MNSLYKRKTKDINGVPRITYYIKYRNAKGKIAGKSTGCRNKHDAEQFRKQFNPKKSTSIDLLTLKEHVLEYAKSLGYYDQYVLTWKTFLDFTKNKPVSQVTRLNIQNYINQRKSSLSKKGKPYSPCSINLELAILKKSFEIAIENLWIESNPAKQVKKLTINNRVPEFTLPEAQALLSELQSLPDKRYYQATLIAFNTGMRRGEVANLKWEQIDIVNSEIHLSNKITKNPEFVTINDVVNGILNEVEKRIDGFVFGIQENYLYEVVKKCIKKLGLNPKLRFHSIRHTFVTEAVKTFGIHTAQDLARHSDISMTAKYYHSRKEEVKDKAKKLII